MGTRFVKFSIFVVVFLTQNIQMLYLLWLSYAFWSGGWKQTPPPTQKGQNIFSLASDLEVQTFIPAASLSCEPPQSTLGVLANNKTSSAKRGGDILWPPDQTPATATIRTWILQSGSISLEIRLWAPHTPKLTLVVQQKCWKISEEYQRTSGPQRLQRFIKNS